MNDLPKPAPSYLDEIFLSSDEARPLRILAEYLDPLQAFRRAHIRNTVVFFGSARIREDGPMSRFYHEARTLARLITEWARDLPPPARHFVICSGGGNGIMEAANRGAADAGGRSIGLNISLPHEQKPNPYITPELTFEFHYFFMRKLWFAHLARALVVFPGGFGTLDELTEILTLAQTHKLEHRIPILLYGQEFWTEVLNVQALVRYGMISPEDTGLFEFVDEPVTAFERVKQVLGKPDEGVGPCFAHSRMRGMRTST